MRGNGPVGRVAGGMNQRYQFQQYFRRREHLPVNPAWLVVSIAAGPGIVQAFAVARAAVELPHG
jgi:hypothetical protein